MSEPVSLIPNDPEAIEAHAAPEQSNGNPIVTWTLIGLNVLMFIVPAVASPSWLWKPTSKQLLDWGADFGPLSLHGEWWRLVTCCFLHLGVIHIAMNMFILLQAGAFAEALFGRVRFLLLYLLAGIGGSLASAFRQPPVVSVGASGAIFGVYGAILAFLLMQRRAVNPESAGKIAKGAGVFLVYNLAFGVAVPGVDLSAHLGGLVAGFLVGLPLARPLTPGRQKSYPLRSALVALVSIAAVAGVLAGTSKTTTPRDQLQRLYLAGNSIPVGKNDRIVYSGTATEADARKLADALIPSGFFGGKGTMLFLRKGADGATISIVTNDKDPTHPGSGAEPQPDLGPHLVPRAWDDPAFLMHARFIGAMAAPALGGPPINVAILTEDGVQEKVLPIDSRVLKVGSQDVIWYSAEASLQDAQTLGQTLTANGFFHDKGALVVLSKQNGSADVSVVVREGSWNDPKVVAAFQSLGGAISNAMGQPVRMHLVDKLLSNKKDI
jgi:membrane associated rhomboid family serine protease